MKHLFIAATLTLVSLPAFSGEAQTFAFGEPAPAAKATRTVDVVLKDIAFEPKSLQVKAGETVRFVLVNEGKLPHEFNLGDKAMHAEHQKEMVAMQGKMFTQAMNHEGMDHSQMMGHMGHGNMNHMNHGGKFDFHHANKINGQAFDMNKPMFAAAKGQYERWVISGVGDMMLHPFHIHGTQFRILSENGKPPAAHRAGWKDTVKVEGNVSEVLVKFNHNAPKEHAYMAHCHLLEHEDTGMMLGFTV